MTMTHPIPTAARATALHLAPEYGPGLVADVEDALQARGTAAPRPGQYVDPVSVGTLIVAIATLAWTVYTDLRNKTPEPAPEVVARQVRVQLRDQGGALPQEPDRITEIVVTEIVRTIREPR
jgi:hypothetical protein